MMREPLTAQEFVARVNRRFGSGTAYLYQPTPSEPMTVVLTEEGVVRIGAVLQELEDLLGH